MKTQLRMEAFYSFSERFAKIRSKRIKKAVKGIGGGLSSEVIDHTLQEGPGNRNKKRLSPHETVDNTSEKDSNKADEKEKNKGNRLEKPSSSRGRAQKRGRGRGRGSGRRNLLPELSDGSSDGDGDGDGDGNDKLVDLQAHEAKAGCPQKSTRSRNPVKYNAKEDDELDESRSNGESLSENLEDDDEFLKNEGRLGNDSAERTQNETATIDASISDCPSEDYIQMGGGFCVEEAETGDAHLENKASDDYRVMGGGFCVDEEETVEEDDAMDAELSKMENEERQNKSKRRNEEDASLEEYDDIEIGNWRIKCYAFLEEKEEEELKKLALIK